jgi:Tfp pilus assembly protein PilN
MKISTNFVRPIQQAVMPLMLAMWLAALGLAGVALWLIDDASELRDELPQLRLRLESIERGGGVIATQQYTPSAQDLAVTRERVTKINAAAQTQGLPTSALLTELEKQLPPNTWLTSFHHRATEGEVLLVTSATNADPLSVFLLNLEQNPLFDQVMLIRELHPTGAGVQFEIRLKVRS